MTFDPGIARRYHAELRYGRQERARARRYEELERFKERSRMANEPPPSKEWDKIAHRFTQLTGTEDEVPTYAQHVQEHVVATARCYQAELDLIRQNDRLNELGKQQALNEARSRANARLQQLGNPETDIGRKHDWLQMQRDEAERAIATRVAPVAERNPIYAEHMRRLAGDRNAGIRALNEAVALLQAGDRVSAAQRQASIDLLQAARLQPSSGLPADLLREADVVLRRSLAAEHASKSEALGTLIEHTQHLVENANYLTRAPRRF